VSRGILRKGEVLLKKIPVNFGRVCESGGPSFQDKAYSDYEVTKIFGTQKSSIPLWKIFPEMIYFLRY
jgi:hypothetical protein